MRAGTHLSGIVCPLFILCSFLSLSLPPPPCHHHHHPRRRHQYEYIIIKFINYMYISINITCLSLSSNYPCCSNQQNTGEMELPEDWAWVVLAALQALQAWQNCQPRLHSQPLILLGAPCLLNLGIFTIPYSYHPCSGIFTYIYHKNKPNVGKHTIHGCYGY